MNKYKFKIKNRRIRIYTPGSLLRSPKLIHEAKSTFTLKGKSSGIIRINTVDYTISKLKGEMSIDAKYLLVMVIRKEILVPVKEPEKATV